AQRDHGFPGRRALALLNVPHAPLSAQPRSLGQRLLRQSGLLAQLPEAPCEPFGLHRVALRLACERPPPVYLTGPEKTTAPALDNYRACCIMEVSPDGNRCHRAATKRAGGV